MHQKFLKNEKEIMELKDLLYLSYNPTFARRSELYEQAVHLKKLLTVMDVVDEKKNGFIRAGRSNDGGYIMYHDFSLPEIAYSFGISDDISWDCDMAREGLEIFMYDHTIKGIPQIKETDIISKFHFFRNGLAASDSGRLKSFNTLLIENGHMQKNNMILKMDIEGCEWDVLSKIDTKILGRFRQIVMEYHSLDDIANASIMYKALEKINETHQLVHIHANNWGKVYKMDNIIFPEVIEATYLNREDYHFTDSQTEFPGELDESCNGNMHDVYLGKWNEY